MVKEFLMKKLLISLGVFACVTVNAQTASDSVVMTVAGKQVPLSEFIFIAEKNGEVDLSNTKSVKNYVELFKNFKLKVAEAESLGIDQTSSFKSELDGYRAQLIDSYMSDKEGEKAAARAVYDRGDHSVELTHILFRLPEKTMAYWLCHSGCSCAASGENARIAPSNVNICRLLIYHSLRSTKSLSLLR